MACCQSHNLISKMIARNISGHCSGVADELDLEGEERP